MTGHVFPKAVLFDLLTALLDSWTLWNAVAGSGYDLFGTSAVGLRTYWHNRVGLARPEGAPPAAVESPTLDLLIPWLEGQSA